MKGNILIIANFLLLFALAAYVFVNRETKKGYILNQRVFNEFMGKQELEEKLKTVRENNQAALDSLATLVQSNITNKEIAAHYDQALRQFELEYQQLSEKYTADIWKCINLYVVGFGEEKGYSFIFGATGEGNLMYADEASDITDEVITYVNARYQSGE